MLHPSPEEIAEGMVQYISALHGDLWEYIRFEGQLYTNNPALIDWDSEIEQWDAPQMGQWPFGNFPTEEEQIEAEALECGTLRPPSGL